MKNIQIIDGAENTTYDIYSCTVEEYRRIFPNDGQNIEFIEDLLDRLGALGTDAVLGEIWKRPIKKQDALGIHGTLFYELFFKKKYYPNKRESDVDDARPWKHG